MEGNPAIQLANDPSPLQLDAESVRSLGLILRTAPGAVHGRQPIRFRVLGADDQLLREEDSAFFAPQ